MRFYCCKDFIEATEEFYPDGWNYCPFCGGKLRE